jgi:hypothetical protein
MPDDTDPNADQADASPAAADGGGPAASDGSVAGIPYRWVAMFVVLFGTFMVVLDTTVVNLGLPSLQRDFDTIVGIEWVVTAYLASVGVSLMASGWAADRFGRKAMFVFSLGLFTFSSLLCAVAPSLDALIGARVLQGIGGGLMMPVGMAMIAEPTLVDGVATGANQYGEWRQEGGNSFWHYYGMYRLMGDFIGPGAYGYNDWSGYRTRGNAAYYGADKQYGTYGSNTYTNPRYQNSAFASRNPDALAQAYTGRAGGAQASIRGAGPASRSQGPSGGGK